MASWVGAAFGVPGGSGVTKAQLEEVKRVIRKTPIIDNHAHPLLKPEALARHPLMAITTEASGDAIHAASTSLSHLRSIKQLAHVLDCGQTWEAVVAAIEQKRIDDYEDWVGECLDGIEKILIDDGLDDVDDVYDYDWHDGFTQSGCKRIVRIETIAGQIIHKQAKNFATGNLIDAVFDKIFEEFDAAIKKSIADSEVVGFKSVICYRTGLDIPAVADLQLAKKSLYEIMSQNSGSAEGDITRISHPGLNDLIVHRAAGLIRDMTGRRRMPIQFHTGLGDNDITLTKSSPAHLQEFIRAYPTVPIVLLHASYPFTREAGYLASVYENVYTDIGEIFPFLSQDGQISAVRQVLELCPWSKILWSTDGHWFPETYLLAVIQIREVLETVLCEYVRKGQLGWKAAIELARAILFQNSNKLYHLGIDFSEWETDTEADVDVEQMEQAVTDLELFTHFMRGQKVPDFIRISWTDFTAMPRMRMVPFRKFMSLLQEGKPTDIGITKACLGLLQHDWMTPGFSATGEYRLHPDFTSLKSGPIPGHFSMHSEFREKDGAMVALCPRTQLSRAQEIAARQGLTFLVGFEIEFVLLQRTDMLCRYEMLTNDGHSWSVSRFFADPKIPKLLANIVNELASMDIHVEQVHPESAPGQFEIVLPPSPPVEAVDTLLHTRDVISALAAASGYKSTLHPKPFSNHCGTAAHAHISISSPGGSKREIYEHFYAGILKHLRAITAFTYSNPASFERLNDGVWAGGRWVAWGTQNRETPLRKIEDSHWEFKAVDGLANPYLAMAALFLAGTKGISTTEKLVWQDCEVDPASLTENDRKELNVTKMLPSSVKEALDALREDEEMTELFTPELVEKYTAVKEFELQFLSSLSSQDRRLWIMERY